MSQFLRNIIARHSTQVSCPVVAPRRRSRFETGTGNIVSPSPQGDEVHITAPIGKNQVPDQASAHLSCGQNGKTGSISTRLQEGSVHWAAAPVNESRPDSFEQRSPAHRTADRTTQLLKGVTADAPITANSNGGEFSVSRGTGQRTRSTLRRLETAKAHDSAHQPDDTNSIDRPGIAPQEILPQSVEVHSASPESGSAGHVSTERVSKIAKPVGLLQTPEWVDEFKSGLQSRYPGMAAQKPVEPTVNVTIGRIEIRATRDKVSNKHEPRNQATGVMSLDDYLEKQNGRRQ